MKTNIKPYCVVIKVDEKIDFTPCHLPVIVGTDPLPLSVYLHNLATGLRNVPVVVLTFTPRIYDCLSLPNIYTQVYSSFVFE